MPSGCEPEISGGMELYKGIESFYRAWKFEAQLSLNAMLDYTGIVSGAATRKKTLGHY